MRRQGLTLKKGRKKGCRKQPGWDRKKTSWLLVDLLKFMSTIDKRRFRRFAATLDKGAYERVASDGIRLKKPEEICNDFCCDVALAWYFQHHPGIIHSAHFFFDAREPLQKTLRGQMLVVAKQ
jgi:hypothetical protein